MPLWRVSQKHLKLQIRQWAKTRRMVHHEQGQEVQLADYFLRHMRARLVKFSVRLLVGLVVFFPEGIQKLTYPDLLGAGRFAKIGIPYPDLMGPFVGAVETICGALIILGLFTRLASIPLIVIMIVAIVSTKIPIFCSGTTSGFFISPRSPATAFGAWRMKRAWISTCCWAQSIC